MKYQVCIKDGYIVSISEGVAEGNITESEYKQMKDVITQKPTAEQGYDYRLSSSLEWELYKLPEPAEGIDE